MAGSSNPRLWDGPVDAVGAEPVMGVATQRPEPQPSKPTEDYNAPHIGTDIPAWDDTQHAAWRASGSDR